MNPRSHRRNKGTQHWVDRKKTAAKRPTTRKDRQYETDWRASGAAAKARADAWKKEQALLEKTSLGDLIK